jgi:hypothetical protein
MTRVKIRDRVNRKSLTRFRDMADFVTGNRDPIPPLVGPITGLGQKKLIISLALPRALSQKWPHLHFPHILPRLHFFEKLHQQLNQFNQIILCSCRNYMLEKCFTKVNLMNKHLIHNLRLKFLLHIPSPFTK